MHTYGIKYMVKGDTIRLGKELSGKVLACV